MDTENSNKFIEKQGLSADRSIASHPVTAHLSTLSPRTRKTAISDLNIIARMAGYPDAMSAEWQLLDYSHVQTIRSMLAEKYSPGSANRLLCALRGVIRAAWRLGQIDDQVYHRIVDIQSVRGSSLPAGRSARDEELSALFAACQRDYTPAGTRDAAILAILYGGGARREEVTKIQIDDYDPATGKIRIQGKGNKERLLYATNGAKTALDAWVQRRGNAPGALFNAIDRWQNMLHTPMTHNAIYGIFRKRCKEAGVTDLSPHDLRRTFVTELLDANIDIKTVADMAGHANIATTARYDKRGEERKQEAAKMIHVPYIPNYGKITT